MNEEADKLEFLRQLGAESWDLSALPSKRVILLPATATASRRGIFDTPRIDHVTLFERISR